MITWIWEWLDYYLVEIGMYVPISIPAIVHIVNFLLLSNAGAYLGTFGSLAQITLAPIA